MQCTFSVCLGSFMSTRKHEHQPPVIKINDDAQTLDGGDGDYTINVIQHIETIPNMVTTLGAREHQWTQFGRINCKQSEQDSHLWQ